MPHMDSVNLICLFKQVIKIMIFLKLDILGLLNINFMSYSTNPKCVPIMD